MSEQLDLAQERECMVKFENSNLKRQLYLQQ